MAALLLVLLVAVLAIRDAEDQREQVRRMLYYSRIALAEREWSQRQDHEP
jgi:hypothetical protein